MDVNMTLEFRNKSVTYDVTNTSDVISELPNQKWGVLFLIPVLLFGITGNVFVCLAISLEKRLQTVTNYFLLSLACTDLLVCTIVMPMSIINDFFGYWRFSVTLCNVFITGDVLMCTSSILHLCCISVQRYLAISRPLKWRNMPKATVCLRIGLIWITAIIISSPVSILGAIDIRNIFQNGQCVLSNTWFKIYGSILAFFIPLVIMVITYTLTVRLLYNQAKRCDPNRQTNNKEGRPIIRRCKTQKVAKGYCYKSKQFPNPNASYDKLRKSQLNNNSRNYDIHLNVPSIISQSVSCERLPSSDQEACEYMLQDHKSLFLSVPRVHRTSRFQSSSESLPTSDIDGDLSEDDDSRSFSRSMLHLPNSDSADKLSLRSTILYKASSFLNLARDKRSNSTCVRTEQKASKVLGIVFAIFLICWLPFFILNIFPVICSTCYISPVLTAIFAWLGWASSTLNPIIYTMFNKTFKRAFVDFTCCRCRSKCAQNTYPHTPSPSGLNGLNPFIRTSSLLSRTYHSERDNSMC